EPRYRIIQKLGWGTYATVWLAKDLMRGAKPKFVALKFGTSDDIGRECLLLQWLGKNKSAHPGSAYVASLLDNFKLNGPNGRHEVLVLKCMVGLRELGIEIPEEAKALGRWQWLAENKKRLAHQSALAISYLHSLGLTH